jgi:hypothetical protein
MTVSERLRQLREERAARRPKLRAPQPGKKAKTRVITYSSFGALVYGMTRGLLLHRGLWSRSSRAPNSLPQCGQGSSLFGGPFGTRFALFSLATADCRKRAGSFI